MKRRLTLHLASGSTLGITLDHAEAELLLERWAAAMADDDTADPVAQLDALPVLHVALAAVLAIADEPDTAAGETG